MKVAGAILLVIALASVQAGNAALPVPIDFSSRDSIIPVANPSTDGMIGSFLMGAVDDGLYSFERVEFTNHWADVFISQPQDWAGTPLKVSITSWNERGNGTIGKTYSATPFIDSEGVVELGTYLPDQHGDFVITVTDGIQTVWEGGFHGVRTDSGVFENWSLVATPIDGGKLTFDWEVVYG